MLFGPGLEGYGNGTRATCECVEPALGERGGVQEGEVVEMCEEPLRVLLGGLSVRGVCRYVEFGDVNWLVVRVAEEIECKVQKPREVITFLYVLDVVVLDLEGCMLNMIEDKQPAQQITSQ